MDSTVEDKRLFFGAQVVAAWPQELPSGRIISEETRHITLAFLGQHDFTPLLKKLDEAPKPAFSLGIGGIGSDLLFLPKEHARVVALKVDWLEDPHPLYVFQQELSRWLEAAGYSLKKHSFMPHITIARTPFEREEWQKDFRPIAFYISAFHLYESLGALSYQSLWTYPLTAPFSELDHTADIAYEIRGNSVPQLFANAQLALFFQFPQLAQFYTPPFTHTLESIIIELNRMIALADTEYGCPFKAVSFHGNIVEKNHMLTWEMIVDV